MCSQLYCLSRPFTRLLYPPQFPKKFKVSSLSLTLSWTWPQARTQLQKRKFLRRRKLEQRWTLLVGEKYVGEIDRVKIRPAREKMPEGEKPTGDATTKGGGTTKSRSSIKSSSRATSSNRRRTIEARQQEREPENIRTCRCNLLHLL